jgi:DNA topoisomerase-3
MGTQEDDGWVNAEDYDGYIPFESKEENEKRLAALHERQAAAADANDELPFGNFDDGSGSRQTYSNEDIVGDCPVCGTHVIEREKGFFCDNMECHFALWKNNRFFEAIGKEMTRQVADDLLNCGTVKLENCVSKRTGNKFNCFVDLSVDEEQRPHFEIRFPERKRRRE